MRRLYAIIPGAPLTRELVGELTDAGLAEEGMRLVSRRTSVLEDLPVSVVGLKPTLVSTWPSALAGAALALMAALLVLAFGVPVPSVGLLLFVLTLAGAAAGAVTSAWRRYPSEVRSLRAEVGRDDVVMLADVPDELLGPVERLIQDRHPEVRVKGTDPRGTPPFP